MLEGSELPDAVTKTRRCSALLPQPIFCTALLLRQFFFFFGPALLSGLSDYQGSGWRYGSIRPLSRSATRPTKGRGEGPAPPVWMPVLLYVLLMSCSRAPQRAARKEQRLSETRRRRCRHIGSVGDRSSGYPGPCGTHSGDLHPSLQMLSCCTTVKQLFERNRALTMVIADEALTAVHKQSINMAFTGGVLFGKK
jgi:hypothetical protein